MYKWVKKIVSKKAGTILILTVLAVLRSLSEHHVLDINMEQQLL